MSGSAGASPEHVSRRIGAGLPPGRLAELLPRLEALLADFAHLAELETADLEPLPAFEATHAAGDGDA